MDPHDTRRGLGAAHGCLTVGVCHGLQLLGWAFTERGADAASESTLELI